MENNTILYILLSVLFVALIILYAIRKVEKKLMYESRVEREKADEYEREEQARLERERLEQEEREKKEKEEEKLREMFKKFMAEEQGKTVADVDKMFDDWKNKKEKI